jgi:CRP-like cAMP-binding protein
MISPELLRRYAFFGMLDDDRLAKIAMLASEENFESGTVIFYEGEPATNIYFLLDGSIDLYYTVSGIKDPALERGIPVGEINPGEPFGISALIEPYTMTSTARVSGPSQVIRIDAATLRSLFTGDRRLAYLFIHQAAQAALERLHASRVQLAAAWA